MIKPKSRMIEPTSEAAASEVFAISDNIVPIRVASVDAILNTEFTEEMEVVPESQVKTLIIQNKTTNPISKFFVRVGTYLDSLESFLNELDANYIKSIEQKNQIVQNEKTEQFLRTYKAKKTAKKLADERKKNKKPTLDLSNETDLNLLLTSLGATAAKGAQAFISVFNGQIFDDVVKKGEFGVQAGTNVVDPPEWIPFPAGTTGLTYTSGFGERWGRPHKGIDISGSIGTPIITPINGMVEVMGPYGTYGNVVFVRSGDLVMEFGHMNSIDVKDIGQELKAGQVIGTLGNTGRSTGPHLHWTIRERGVAVDPVLWTQQNSPLSSTSSFQVEPEEEPLEPRSEGSIERIGKIMVGEAGLEFVVPMSQMPIFAHLMMEEKIKCLIPDYYQPYGRFPDIGFERLSGTSNDVYASGGIVENHKVAARKLTQFFPGKPHVVAGILGNLEHEAPGLKPDTYQYGGGPGRGIAQWEVNHAGNKFKGRWPMAVRLYGENAINSLPNQLDFIKWELDTSHVVDGIPRVPSGYATKKYVVDIPRNVHEATKNFMYDFERPDSIAQANWETERFPKAMFFMKNMNVLLAKEPEPKPETKVEEKPQPVKPRPKTRPTNIKEALWDFGIVPGLRDAKKSWGEFIQQFAPKDRSSLNNIPGNEQMEIASEDQDQFSFDNAKGEIIALYKPTVYYSDPA